MTPALELDGVGLRFGTGRERVSDLCLSLAPGATATVCGPAGGGKTLLVEVASLFRRTSRGSVRLFGQRSAGLHPDRLARLRRRIGWVEARPAPIPGLDAVSSVALPLLLAGMDRAEARARAREMIAWLEDGTGNGAPCAHGVALARAVVGGPELVMVDEVAALPGPLRWKLSVLVAQLGRQGVAFLLTSREEPVLTAVPAALRFGMADGRLSPMPATAR